MNSTSNSICPDHTLDTSGLFCPEPVMMLHNKIRDMVEGEVIADPLKRQDRLIPGAELHLPQAGGVERFGGLRLTTAPGCRLSTLSGAYRDERSNQTQREGDQHGEKLKHLLRHSGAQRPWDQGAALT